MYVARLYVCIWLMPYYNEFDFFATHFFLLLQCVFFWINLKSLSGIEKLNQLNFKPLKVFKNTNTNIILKLDMLYNSLKFVFDVVVDVFVWEDVTDRVRERGRFFFSLVLHVWMCKCERKCWCAFVYRNNFFLLLIWFVRDLLSLSHSFLLCECECVGFSSLSSALYCISSFIFLIHSTVPHSNDDHFVTRN